MKRFLCILLSVLIVFTAFSSTISAKTEDYDFVTVEKDFGEVYFNCNYAEIGKDITVRVNGREDEKFLYKWYVDGLQITNTTDTYTPLECDLESMLEVEVYDFDGQLAGRKSMFVSLLPVVYIETENREPVVIKNKYLNADIKIQGNTEFDDATQLYEGKAQIRGRGNSTWRADKKPYRLKLDSKADLFGMGKNKHWVLLSNPFDTSLLRNTVSYNLADDFGLQFEKSVWVDVVFNGKVIGNYQLCEHIRVDETRVNITNWEDVAEDAAKAIYNGNKATLTKDDRDGLIDIMTEDMSWTTGDMVTYNDITYTVSDYFEYPDINGGYLLEIGFDEDKPGFVTDNGVSVCIDTPDTLSDDMLESIREYYQAFENALFADDFCTEYNGKTVRYTDLIDLESFVNGLLVNEIFENADFGYKSTWMSKEVDGKLVYGPVWDMDYTTASTSFYKWTSLNIKWLSRLLSDPVFLTELRKSYFEHRYTDIHDLIRDGGDIDTAISKITSSAQYNDEIWKNEINFLDNANDFKLRLQEKINWLDRTLATVESACSSVGCDVQAARELSTDLPDLSLDITTLPDKLTYNAGETLDLAGLAVTATTSEGVTQAVTPDTAYTYVKDTIGEQLFAYGKVTEEIGETYVVICYKNSTAEFKINVNPRENYTDVDALIKNLPDKIDSNRFVNEFFEAQVSYNALSEAAKQKVANADKLSRLISDFEKNAEENDQSVVACFADGVFRSNARSAVVTVSKGEPRKILYVSPNGSTATYSQESSAYISQKKVGNFSVTTIKHLIADDVDFFYKLRALYKDNRPSTAMQIRVAELADEAKIINSISYNKQLNAGEKLVVKLDRDADARSVRLTENSSNLNAVLKFSADGDTLTKEFERTGKHTITLEYLYGSTWITYGSFDIYVRDAIPTEGKIFGIDYPKQSYVKDIDVSVVTTTDFEALSLICGETAVPMTFTNNGDYRIWTASANIRDGKAYTLYADGKDTGYTVDCTLLDSFETDGTKLVKFLADTDTAEIPEYITEIADDAFDGFEGTIYCYPDSAAEKFAMQNGIDFVTFSFEVNTSDVKLQPDESIPIEITASPYMPEDFVLNTKYDSGVIRFENNTLTALRPGYTKLHLSSDGGSFSHTVYVYVGGGLTKADVNGDEKINSIDALIILQANVGKVTFTEKEKLVADVTGDGKVNSIDALVILQISTMKKTIWEYID
ncbi:MAG: CotH kinase family protein [Clostridia bacterium]|nr:CotH kinase family protein [Clostridia bacterium]